VDEEEVNPGSIDVSFMDMDRGQEVSGRDAGLSIDSQMRGELRERWSDLQELLQLDLQRLLECIYPPTANVALGCVLCDARMMELIHLQAKGTSKATDVLSIIDQGPDGPLLGELWINVECIEAEAKKRGCDEVDEFRVLAAHGVLHLTGHDHERGLEALHQHAAEEIWVLNHLGWRGTGLIERCDAAALDAVRIAKDDPRTPWERLPGNVRKAAYDDIERTKKIEIKDPSLEGAQPEEIKRKLEEDKAKYQASVAELHQEIETELIPITVAGLTFNMRAYKQLQFYGCGSISGGALLLGEWARVATKPAEDRPMRVLEIGAGCIGIIGAVLAKLSKAEVTWTDRQAAAVKPLRSNLELSGFSSPEVERFDYAHEDPVAWANGRTYDLIVFSSDAILFKVDLADARGRQKGEPDPGLERMLSALSVLLAEGGRAMVGVNASHPLLDEFWQQASDAGFRVSRVGDHRGKPVQDARYPKLSEMGVVRLVPPRKR